MAYQYITWMPRLRQLPWSVARDHYRVDVSDA